ncbi:hypothetical protein EG68_07847 [Paragonimus skrjabini miyazakii]|uniref:glutathione transferase n=1 Tax=Paragonimus skrjabini miyazakii TaxID=59628 RepID=A0A8S9YKY5_9TREM|nr:hypothetical protein EG68_07847 [Paragonimus skrjabini miyazakii]
MAPVLGYWKLRGRAQCIRLFLEYLQQPYDERLYDKCDMQKWFEGKHSMGFEFPNLPYYIDGDFKLTETVAILRYIADQHGTLGSNAKERAVISMLESAAVEMRANAAKVAYSKQPEEEKELVLKNLPRILGYWSNFLSNKEFLMGSKQLPQISAYMKSSRFIKWPLHSWLASFGGGDVPPEGHPANKSF